MFEIQEYLERISSFNTLLILSLISNIFIILSLELLESTAIIK